MVSNFVLQSPFSEPAPHQGSLPQSCDLRSAMNWVQNLLIYDVATHPFYGVELSSDRANDIHVRHVSRMIGRLKEFGPETLSEAREPKDRLAARCSSFALMLISLLRHQGISARARVGFANYFKPGTAEDHWIVEYWDEVSHCWRFADPMFDDIWRRKLDVRHNILDVPRDKFLTASLVWRKCREGTMDAGTAGIAHANLYGLFFIAGSLVRDVAALCRMELLPWDMWGAQPRPHEELSDAQLDYFDGLAEMLVDPDVNLTAIRARFVEDSGLSVPDQVFNLLRNRTEPIHLQPERGNQ